MPLFFAMKHKRYINAFITTLGFVIVGWLSFIRPDLLLLDAAITFLFSAILIFICFTPAGNLTFGIDEGKISLGKWFRKLLLGQSALAIFTLAAYVAYFGGGPIFATGDLSLKFAENAILDYTPLQWGIFPWGVYGIWAVVIAYVTYVKKGQPYLFQIAREYCPRRFEPMIKTFIEGTNSGSTIMVFSLIGCAIVLLLTYPFETIFKFNHFAVPSVTFTVLSFLSATISFKFGRKLFKLMTVKSQSYIGFYVFMIVMLVIFLIISCFANEWFMKKYPIVYQLQCPQCGNYFANVPLESRFAAVYWGWWMIWAPLAGSYLAKISKGSSIREFTLGLFIVPVVLTMIRLYWGVAPFVAIKTFIQEGVLYALIASRAVPIEYYASGAKAIMLILLGLVTFGVFIKMIAQFRTSAVFNTGFMPVDPSAKENRLWLEDGTKSQGISKMAQKLSLALLATIFIHTLSGWYGIQLEVAAMGILVINAIYAGFDLLLIRFFTDKVWLGNRNIPPY